MSDVSVAAPTRDTGGPSGAPEAGGMARQVRREWRGQVAAILPLAFLVGAFVVPIIGLAILSLRPTNELNTPQPGWSLEQYQQVFSTSYLRNSVLHSLWLAIRVSITCAVLAYPVAWFLARTTSAWARTAVFTITLSPLLTSEVVRSFGWRIVMGGEGPVNQALQALHLTDDSLPLLRSGWTVYLAVVHVLLPFAIISLTASLGAIDDSLLRAAANLGASRPRTFFTVVLPMSVPGLVAGLAIVFSLTMGIYVTPLLVGGATQPLAGLRIQNLALTTFDQPGAAALSFVLLGVTLLACGLLGLLGRFSGRRVRA